ncbi:MAG: protein translocase subunit SecD, partial [Actinobacteria bacterium]|nr:protein translocase subunit SecD [Actinomycetota bacterium]
VVSLVSQTAQLQFRQVLLEAPNTSAAAPSPSPSATPSGSPSGSASASPSASTKAKVSSPRRGAQTLTDGSRRVAASASPSPSGSPAATPSPTASATPSAAGGTTPWQQAQGDPSLAGASVKALFNKLNCADPNWKKQVGYTAEQFNNPNIQTVSCGKINGVTFKYALDKAKVVGKDISSARAALQQNSTNWQVNLNFNSAGTKAWGDLTTAMFDKYKGNSQLAQNQTAIVLDGTTTSSPYIAQAQVSGQSQITGNFSQTEATTLANVLSYGALPLSFHQQSVQSVTPQLGRDQLTAGLLAGAIGLILVVIYAAIYYRGLAVVAVSSLIIAGLLAFEAVVVLGKYQGFALNLAGVAGLIVAIGITADSFIVYFERLRDEVREGRSLRTAVERGWGRARRTVLVADAVSFLAAALLYYFAIGEVKGFAFTLGLTTIIDVVVVFLFTKPTVTLLARTKFYGRGHRLSGLDPARLGARAPWRGTTVRRPGRPPARTPGAREA